MIIFLLTGNIRDGNFDQADLFARVLLLVCMFLISHTLIMLLRFFKDQAEAAAKSETMEKLLEIQSDQYSLLTARTTAGQGTISASIWPSSGTAPTAGISPP